MTHQQTLEYGVASNPAVTSDKLAARTLSKLDAVYNDKLLTSCLRRIERGDVWEAMDQLVKGLEVKRSESSILEWTDFKQYCLMHPIMGLVHEDPFTERAYRKPRGYAGDAELMDIIYEAEYGHVPRQTSEIGRGIFEYTTNSNACQGVRKRARLVAEIVDRLALEVERADILSVAAGHLREADLTGALKQRRIGRWVALDSDAESLEEVERCYARYGVETVPGTVRQLLGRKVELGAFDFIYSTGLYDYLQQPLARRLTTRLFEMLNPGGRLVVANFLNGIDERGYMESYMDWQLVYRSHADMLDLAMAVDQEEVDDIRLRADDKRCILFLHISRR
jgi:hypothetical protein